MTMPLAQKITEDLKKAIKAKDELPKSCLRMLKTALKNRQVEVGHELNDEEIHKIISSLIRKGQEAAKEFSQGGRKDLVDREEEEIKILYSYLPEQLNVHDIEKKIKEIISEVSADSLKDLGKVMKIAMGQLAGKAQGREVNEIARRLLS
ncbi:MAG: GatB/YqeY domain-containing protein [Thermodesulfobacteriota bacterium]|nr:GatB/YqeY domain-containing protein [Thermodesulfobacteriota bacterium]